MGGDNDDESHDYESGDFGGLWIMTNITLPLFFHVLVSKSFGRGRLTLSLEIQVSNFAHRFCSATFYYYI